MNSFSALCIGTVSLAITLTGNRPMHACKNWMSTTARHLECLDVMSILQGECHLVELSCVLWWRACFPMRLFLKYRETPYLVGPLTPLVCWKFRGLSSPAERAEKIGYNALPATITPDMWAHQYLQQGNEMNAVTSDQHIWFSDGPNSTL